ncbi:MAG: hypothetical protein ACP5LD_14920, partial [Desulfomonilaceae bacterium]
HLPENLRADPAGYFQVKVGILGDFPGRRIESGMTYLAPTPSVLYIGRRGCGHEQRRPETVARRTPATGRRPEAGPIVGFSSII